jgi:LPXTG-motif cell wall-anchored protein
MNSKEEGFLPMKISALAAAGTVAAIAVSAALMPSAAFAEASVSWSQPTICPGETAILTVNGVSDAVVVPMGTNEHGMVNDFFAPITAGPYTYEQADAIKAFGAIAVVIVYTTNPGVVPGSLLARDSIEVLTECVVPEPEPVAVPSTESTGLPDTGITRDMAGVAIGAAFLFAIAGFFIVRGRRQLTAVSINEKVSARMKQLNATLSRMEDNARRRRNRRR